MQSPFSRGGNSTSQKLNLVQVIFGVGGTHNNGARIFKLSARIKAFVESQLVDPLGFGFPFFLPHVSLDLEANVAG